MATFINVKNLVYAKMTDEDAKTYEEVKTISPLMTVKVDTTTSSEILYGDGTTKERQSVVGETTVEFGINDIPQEVQADLLGHTLDAVTGVLTENGEDEAPYAAIGFQIEKSNGNSVYYWFLKGTFDEIGIDAQQQAEKPVFSTPTLKGTFIYRSDGNKKFQMDEDSGTTVPSDFLSTVYEPTTV